MSGEQRLDQWWEAIREGIEPEVAADFVGATREELNAELDARVTGGRANKGLTADELADMFLDSSYGRDYAVFGSCNDGHRVIRYPKGRWASIKERRSDGSILYDSDDPLPIEVRSAVLSFLRSIGEPVSWALCVEIERLSRLLVIQREDR